MFLFYMKWEGSIESNTIINNCLIPITYQELIDKNIKSKLISITNPYFTRCPNCSYIDQNEIIEIEEYERCLICIFDNNKYPFYLIFVLI